MNELLRRIQYLSFVLVEVNLYLDTHPTDMAALNYYHTYKALYNRALSEYTSQYGPLTPGTVESRNRWTWIDKPWPWEREA
ncbi:MAG: spore coat protein CotJB [Peptostreptococcales bacterium]|jgi:spore coat protein JB